MEENELNLDQEREAFIKFFLQKRDIKKIKFKELSGWLKLSIVIGWIIGVEMLLAFLYGLILGLFGV